MKPARIHLSLIILVLAYTLTACTIWGQSKTPSWNSATGAEQFERLMWMSLKNKKYVDIETHLASNFVYAGADGVKNKDEVMALLRTMQVESYTLGDFQTTPHGDDIICIYTVTMKGTMNGQKVLETPTRVMTVWQKQKSGWVQAAEADISLPGK